MLDNINWFNINVTIGGLLASLAIVYYAMYLVYKNKRNPDNLERNALINIRNRLLAKSSFHIKRYCIIPMFIMKYFPVRSLGKLYADKESPLNPDYDYSIWYIPSFAVSKYSSFQELKREYEEFCIYVDRVIALINSSLNAGSTKIELEGHTFNITVIKTLTAHNYRKVKFPTELFTRIVEISRVAFEEKYKATGNVNPLDLEEHLLNRTQYETSTARN